jgi:hypothetical protein
VKEYPSKVTRNVGKSFCCYFVNRHIHIFTHFVWFDTVLVRHQAGIFYPVSGYLPHENSHSNSYEKLNRKINKSKPKTAGRDDKGKS